MHTDDFDGFVVTINGTTHYVDGTVPDKTLNTVSDYNSLLRDMINIPTIHEHYYSNLSREHWAQLCAAMDVIRDSQRAIDKYQEIDQIDYIHGDALYIYGLLNAFYLQQDAATTIFKIIVKKKELNYFDDYPEINKIRRIRDDVCHATDRNIIKGKIIAQIFISPSTVTKNGFCYLKYTTSDGNRKVVTIHVDIDDCIAKQANDIKDILCTICKKILSSISPDVQKEYLESWSQAMKAL